MNIIISILLASTLDEKRQKKRKARAGARFTDGFHHLPLLFVAMNVPKACKVILQTAIDRRNKTSGTCSCL
jgi:hypothetical protein